MDAMTYELDVEHNSRFDYESELWASERESMALEGYNAQCDELDADLESGTISMACHNIRLRRLQKEYRVGPFEIDTRTDQERTDEVIDGLFATGGRLHHMACNEDNGPEA